MDMREAEPRRIYFWQVGVGEGGRHVITVADSMETRTAVNYTTCRSIRTVMTPPQLEHKCLTNQNAASEGLSYGT